MTLLCNLYDENGNPMTAQEFLELAEKQGAILTPEQTEKCRQDTVDFFSRYHVSYDTLFGNWDIVDTHSWGYRFVKFCFGSFLLLCVAFLIWFMLLVLVS